MATKLGQLIIELQANTAAFARGMSDAKNLSFQTSGDIVNSLQRVGDQLARLKFDSAGEFKKSIGIAGGLIAGIGVGVAAASVVVAKEVAEQAKQMEKLSQSYGLPVEMVSQLRVASKLTGVDMEVLTAGLGRMAKAASLAAEGSGQQTKAFQALGVQVNDSQGHLKPMNELLPQIAERFSKMQDGTGKTALAMQLFGRAGAQLIPFLNQGSAGIKQLQQLSDQLGLTWTEKDIQAAEIFKQRLEIMDLKSTALKENFVKGLLPALDQIATAFTQTNAAGTSAAQVLGEVVGDAIKYTIVGLYSLITDWKQFLIIIDLRKWGKEAQDAFDAAGKAYRDFATAVLYGKPIPPLVSLHGGKTTGTTPTFPGKSSGASEDIGGLLASVYRELDRGNALQEQIDHIRDLQRKFSELQAAHPESSFHLLDLAAEELDKKLKALVADQASLNDKLSRGVVPGGNGALQSQIASMLNIPVSTPTLGGSVQQQHDLYELGQSVEEQNRRRLEIYNATRTPAEQYAQDVQELNILFQQGGVDGDTYQRALQNAKDRFTELYDPTVKLRKEQEDLDQALALGAINAAAYAQRLKELRAAEAQAAIATNPQGGLGGVKQGIGAGALSVGADWKGIASESSGAMISAAHGMQSAFSTAFSQMAMGAKNFRQAMAQLGQALIGSIVDACAQMLSRWIVTHLLMAGITKIFHVQAAVSESVSGAVTNSALATSAAFLGAANAYAFWAWNPPVAAAFSAAALAAGLSFAASSLSAGMAGTAGAVAAERGTEITRNGQVIIGHVDEGVLPAPIYQGFKRIINSYDLTQSSGRGHMGFSGGSKTSIGRFQAPVQIQVNGAADPNAVANKVARVTSARVMSNLRRKYA